MDMAGSQTGGSDSYGNDAILNALAASLGMDPASLGNLKSAMQYRMNTSIDADPSAGYDPSVRLLTNAAIRAGWQPPLLPIGYVTPVPTSNATSSGSGEDDPPDSTAVNDDTQPQEVNASQDVADAATENGRNPSVGPQDVQPNGDGFAWQPLEYLTTPIAQSNFDPTLAPRAATSSDTSTTTGDFNDQVHTIEEGDTVERIARRYFPDNYRAGTQIVMDANGLVRDNNGNPIIRAGDSLFIPDPRRFSSDDMAQYAKSGGQMIADNQGLRNENASQAYPGTLPVDPEDGMRVGPTLERLRLLDPEFAAREQAEADQAQRKQQIDQAIAQANLPKMIAVDPQQEKAAAYNRLRAQNSLGMALLGPFAGPGLVTRAFGGDENTVAAGNEVGAGMFGLAAMAAGTPLRNRTAQMQDASLSREEAPASKIELIDAKSAPVSDEAARELIPHEGAAKNGYPGVQQLPNGSPTFANSDYLFPVGEGQKNIVSVRMTGSRRMDSKLASRTAGILDLVPPGSDAPTGYTWHHVGDLDPNTGAATFELVDSGAHNAANPHFGSVRQWVQLTGIPYRR